MKFYEALEKARRERNKNGSGFGTEAGSKPSPPKTPDGLRLPKSIEGKLLSMNQRIESTVGRQTGIVVEFVGSPTSEDASKLVYEFAKLVAFRLNRKVLLLAAGAYPHVREVFSGASAQQWEEVIEDSKLAGEVVHPVDETQTATSLVSGAPMPPCALMTSSAGHAIFDDLRQRFDLILIDAPPLGVSSDAVLLSSVIDGVVLVIEAGKTRWQVIKHDLDEITARRGRVLGVVFNKQRHYIPEFLYRLL